MMIFDRVGLGMGFQTWKWGSRHGDGVPGKRWGSRHGDGVPDMGMWFQTRGGVPDMGMGFLTWGRGSRKRGGVTTFMSHQSEILHSLIFCCHPQLMMQNGVYPCFLSNESNY